MIGFDINNIHPDGGLGVRDKSIRMGAEFHKFLPISKTFRILLSSASVLVLKLILS